MILHVFCISVVTILTYFFSHELRCQLHLFAFLMILFLSIQIVHSVLEENFS